MSEWWTYRAEDFLLFSPRVYWRMFELHNAALWPLHVLTLAAGIIILLVAWRPTTWARARWIAFIRAILWIFVGWSFLWNRYATINWAAAYLAPAFAVEGILLLILSIRDGLAFDRRGPAGWTGYLILLRTRRTAIACAAAGTRLGLVRSLRHRAGSDRDGDARRSAPCPRHAFADAAANSRSLLPPERHNPQHDGRAASLGPLCRPGVRRCSLDLDDHLPARIASARLNGGILVQRIFAMLPSM
jgi:hypothetical protein